MEMNNRQRKLFFIEWKYVEQYKSQPPKAEGKSGQTRIKTYTPLLEQNDCPFRIGNIEGLFTEPYYQLMRQTLLANEMTKAKEYGTTDYMHLHKTEGSFLKYIEVDATEHAQSSYIKWIYP